MAAYLVGRLAGFRWPVGFFTHSGLLDVALGPFCFVSGHAHCSPFYPAGWPLVGAMAAIEF